VEEIIVKEIKVEEVEKVKKIGKVPVLQLFNLCIAAIGLQFAWAMQINLTGRVIEPLGATPLLLGLMWLAGPIAGIIIQPIVGTLSDNIWTRFGRRRPFLLIGAILGAVALIAMPYAPSLIAATSILWIIDICVNVSQTPHRALIPDVMHSDHHALANSFISFGVGVGAVIAFGLPYILKEVFHYQVDLKFQFILAAIVLVFAMSWTCFTVVETDKPELKPQEKKENPFDQLINFGYSCAISAFIICVMLSLKFFGEVDFSHMSSQFIINILSWFVIILHVPMLIMASKNFYTKEIGKLCAMQYFTWMGMICLLVYFNNYVVHNIYHVPDLSSSSVAIKLHYNAIEQTATNISGLGFAIYNISCLLVSIPLGLLCGKFGKKNIHAISLLVLSISMFGLAFIAKTPLVVLLFMALAGIGWASILTIPYSLLIENAKPGTEGVSLGKFNLFVAGPQILALTGISYVVDKSPLAVSGGMTNHWEYAFIMSGIAVFIAALVMTTIRSNSISKNNN
jgi:maltose/moltooligosaccharide transporter